MSNDFSIKLFTSRKLKPYARHNCHEIDNTDESYLAGSVMCKTLPTEAESHHHNYKACMERRWFIIFMLWVAEANLSKLYRVLMSIVLLCIFLRISYIVQGQAVRPQFWGHAYLTGINIKWLSVYLCLPLRWSCSYLFEVKPVASP